ncbi:MAG: argininosuccinate lyase [Verrucomicrobia bacterium]|nr:argininosuccinate lyase [Verrucomicrobiota bacterium]
MSTGKQQTWGGRFSEGPAQLMVRFSESVSFDKRLAPYDIACSTAHSAMLAEVGLISPEERDAIHAGLKQIGAEIAAGTFDWSIDLEDVHMNIEQRLTERVPAAAKLHTGRSRNDQVATDMRLFFKDACRQLKDSLRATIGTLVDTADRCQGVQIPGYTHLQRAQPVSMAHHILAWVEMLGRDLERFERIEDQANWCPLGCGALAGSTLPLDRNLTARLLGFVDRNGKPRVCQNSMDAVADRDVFLEFASACALCGVHLSRIAEDIILWSSAEFAFVSLPDAFTTGSSLMPQKKNPDAMELTRGKAGRLIGHQSALFAMVKGLPLTYNRDLQEDKPPVFDALDTTRDCLAVLSGTVQGMQPKMAKCAAAVKDPALLATDLVDYLVLRGIPFRHAHHIIGALVGMAERTGRKLTELRLEEVRSIDPAFGEDWLEVFDLERAQRMREKPGMPGAQQIKDRIQYWRTQLS